MTSSSKKVAAFVVGLALWAIITWPWLWKAMPLVAVIFYIWLFVTGRVISKATRDRMERENGN